ncbi:MAG: hypothetical protein EP330_16215 [Deltaproteobacteria bacterium]|nr:MAG: hypothetical protein EP330_16215 [Deltaproteobacteria bacterium]
MSTEPRRYQLIERLGQGGFGVVYRARLHAAHGFAKDVAVKLLHADVPESAVSRFRDEARILGLLSDRAIVAVDAPVQLDGQWALVMEFVDGADIAALLVEGPLPARVAVEVVGEVARALQVAQDTPGPDGQPLGLLHRDLKPANLRITPSGQLKILDFGVARAAFEAREVRTTQHISGTPAYIAPERLRGVESASGDVYSLGVVLHEMVVGQRPSPDVAEPTFEDVREAVALDDVLALSRAMRAADPGSRPSAREVEETCEALAASLDGPSLRRWAEERVRTAVGRGERVDGSLSESASASPPSSRARWPAVAGVAGLSTVALIGAAIALRPSPPDLHDALSQPILHFVMEDAAAASERTELRRPEAWDAAWVARVEARLADFDRPEDWARLDQVVDDYGAVLAAVRDYGLPEVIAGVPWVESRYMPELQSAACAKGVWQFMPWSAVNGDGSGLALEVAHCRFHDDAEADWTPAPGPFPPRSEWPLDAQGCRIPQQLGCAVDERSDVAKSTALALSTLSTAWKDPDLRASGAVVPLTLAAHNLGLPAVRALTAEPAPLAAPQGDAAAEYSAWVVASHFAATCYYGKNYPERPEFAPYARYVDLYCAALAVPDRSEVAF